MHKKMRGKNVFKFNNNPELLLVHNKILFNNNNDNINIICTSLQLIYICEFMILDILFQRGRSSVGMYIPNG